jgi:hypothetical protein
MKTIISRDPQTPREDFTMNTTDLYKHLLSQRELLLERIAGTEGKWKAHWQAELAAVTRCLWALGTTP